MCPVLSSVSAVELALWFISAPCPPDEIVASLDCAANEALISWRGQLDVNSYTAIITDEDQGLLSCSSINTSCSIPNLKCSQLYTVTVSHHDGICPSMPSQPVYMESGSRIRFSSSCRCKVFGIHFLRSSLPFQFLVGPMWMLTWTASRTYWPSAWIPQQEQRVTWQ